MPVLCRLRGPAGRSSAGPRRHANAGRCRSVLLRSVVIFLGSLLAWDVAQAESDAEHILVSPVLEEELERRAIYPVATFPMHTISADPEVDGDTGKASCALADRLLESLVIRACAGPWR